MVEVIQTVLARNLDFSIRSIQAFFILTSAYLSGNWFAKLNDHLLMCLHAHSFTSDFLQPHGL